MHNPVRELGWLPVVLRVFASAGAASYVLAALAAGGLIGTLLRIPIQLSDCLIPMLQMLDARSAWSVFVEYTTAPEFFRPLFWTQVKLGVDLAQGSYFTVFKGFHAALVLTLFLLFAKTSRVRRWSEMPVFAFSIVVLIGLHTFVGMVWEGFPINHYLEVAVVTLAALVFVESRPSVAVDAAAVVFATLAALILETGLLVGVVVIGGRLLGARGVSTRATWLVAALVLAYLALRFGVQGAGVPGMHERRVGFWLDRLSTDEARLRFGAAPVLLYAYNIMASVMSVWLSEPRAGVFELVREWRDGALTPVAVIGVYSSAVASLAILYYAWLRRAAWSRGRIGRRDRVVLLAALVTLANACVAFVYVKDEVMSAAGVFYALAAGVGLRAATRSIAHHWRERRLAVALGALAMALALCCWAVRGVGVHHRMLYIAAQVRMEWMAADKWLAAQGVRLSPGGRAMTAALAARADEMPAVYRHFLPRWGDEWFGSGR